MSSTDAVLVVAERSLEPTIERMGFTPGRPLLRRGHERNSKDVPAGVPTHDTASRDLAFIVSTTGSADRARTSRTRTARSSRRASRPSTGSTSDAATPSGARRDADLAAGDVEHRRRAVVARRRGRPARRRVRPDERLDLLFRLGPSILCQSPGRVPRARRAPASSSASARRASAASSRPATSSIPRSSPSSRSAGA